MTPRQWESSEASGTKPLFLGPIQAWPGLALNIIITVIIITIIIITVIIIIGQQQFKILLDADDDS